MRLSNLKYRIKARRLRKESELTIGVSFSNNEYFFCVKSQSEGKRTLEFKN